jgi:hypothetical protein
VTSSTRPSSDTAPTSRDIFVARRPLHGEAGARSESPERTVVPHSHRRAGAFASRPRRRRADDVKSESDRVRGEKVGMVSNQMEAGRLAQE